MSERDVSDDLHSMVLELHERGRHEEIYDLVLARRINTTQAVEFLIYAAVDNLPELARPFLRAGISPGWWNEYNQPMDIAKAYGNHEVLDLFYDHYVHEWIVRECVTTAKRNARFIRQRAAALQRLGRIDGLKRLPLDVLRLAVEYS